MTFTDWFTNSIYGKAVETNIAHRDYTEEEMIAAMEAAWQAGMKEQYRREQYAQRQHSRTANAR